MLGNTVNMVFKEKFNRGEFNSVLSNFSDSRPVEVQVH
eukprot:gene10059-7029_t